MGDMGMGGGTADNDSFPFFFAETDSLHRDFLPDLKGQNKVEKPKYIIRFCVFKQTIYIS